MDPPPVSYSLPTRSRHSRSKSRTPRFVTGSRPPNSTSHSSTKPTDSLSSPRSIHKSPDARATFPPRRSSSDASDHAAPPLERPALHTFIQFRPSTPYPGGAVNETKRNTKLNQANFSAFHQRWVLGDAMPPEPVRPPAQGRWGLRMAVDPSGLPVPVPGSSREAVAAMREKFNQKERRENGISSKRSAEESSSDNATDMKPRITAASIVGTRQVSPMKRERSNTTGTSAAQEPPVKKARSNSRSTSRTPTRSLSQSKHSKSESADDLNPNKIRGRRGHNQPPHRKQSKKRTTSPPRDPDPWTICPSSEAKAAMPPEIVEQYELAGLDYHEPLPRGRFPHASFERRDPTHRQKLTLTKAELNTELQCLNPKPKATQQNSDGDRVMKPAAMPREMAVETMTIIMNRLVERGEYARAARAFGLLLRTRLKGKGMDLRAEKGWGLAVDILLHQGEPVPPRVQMREMPDANRYRFRNKKVKGRRRRFKVYYSDSEEEEPSQRRTKEVQKTAEEYEEEMRRRPEISEQSWAKAKEFFEYLALQFPAAGSSLGKTNAFAFYYQMYGMWIKHIEELRKSEELKAHEEFGNTHGENIDIESGENEPNTDDSEAEGFQSSSAPGLSTQPPANQIPSPEHSTSHQSDGDWRSIDLDNEELTTAVSDVVQATYERVQALAEHMDTIVKSLPFSGDHSLVALRAKIERWMAELSVPLPARMHFKFPLHSDDDDWDEDVIWGRHDRQYTRDGKEARSDSESDSGESNDEGEGVDGRELNGVPAKIVRKLHRVKKTRTTHIKEAKRLMGASVFLRRSAHLRVNSWTLAEGTEQGDRVDVIEGKGEDLAARDECF